MARWHRGASATSFSSPTSIGCTGEHRSGPGRPPAITRQVGRWIVALAKLPYSFGEICRTMGVSYSVLKAARRRYPGFLAALAYARTCRLVRVAEARDQEIRVAVVPGQPADDRCRGEGEAIGEEREPTRTRHRAKRTHGSAGPTPLA